MNLYTSFTHTYAYAYTYTYTYTCTPSEEIVNDDKEEETEVEKDLSDFFQELNKHSEFPILEQKIIEEWETYLRQTEKVQIAS